MKRSLFAVLALLALLAGGVALYLIRSPAPAPDRFAQCRTDQTALGGSQIGGPFTLVSETGETVTDADIVTGPTLIYFGYTFCPDVCPLDNTRNAQAVYLLDERGYDVTPVFISIDPGRDTPELLAQFTEYMHPRMIGLTGTPEQVAAASRAYRTFYSVQDPEEEFYLIDHSTLSYLVFPEIGFVEHFKRDVTPADMADRIACFVDSL
ncbi:SCO family protein [Rhodovulum adriaticum]|uniref:Protein SCO1/2 n=1 Tax=Rhodovulum adriaticum TaxID=35804 RepID=A0A4R2NZ38_RHOAD|nr:SCO family protein [Rhodovulum adriaticum]MBK1636147.1 SCO family protein [Rhodovulum adriaticum]TCP27530.1 protein SCO1/2 [Rhodovulum adriaticum]